MYVLPAFVWMGALLAALASNPQETRPVTLIGISLLVDRGAFVSLGILCTSKAAILHAFRLS